MAAPLRLQTRALRNAVQRPGVLLLAISLLALLLRTLRLGFQPLWWDEGYSVFFATSPVAEMLSLTSQDIHPPLYYLLLGGWIELLGPSPVSVRLLSVVIGVAAVPIGYVAGRGLAGRRVGALTALILAVSPSHVFYSQEIRMYGLVALLGLVSTALAGQILRQEHAHTVSARCRWALYVITTLLALYTQYYAVLLPLAHTLYAFSVWHRSPRRLLRWMAAQLTIALAFLPWVLYAAPQLVPYVAQKVVKDADRPLGLVTYLARHLATFGAGHFEGWLAPWWPLGLLPVPLIAWAAWRSLGRGGQGSRDAGAAVQESALRPTAGLLLASLVLPLLLGFVLNLRYPFFPERGERLLLLALPSFLLLLAMALDDLWSRSRKVGILVLSLLILLSALSLTGFYTVQRYAADDYRPVVQRVVQGSRGGDVVFCVFPWQVGYMRSYAPDGPSAELSPSPAWGTEVEASLDSALAGGAIVWVPAHLSLGGILEQAIEKHLLKTAYPVLNEWHGPNTRLIAYSGGSADSAGPGEATFGEWLALSGSGWGESTVEAGNEVLAVELAWRLVGQPVGDARVVLRLADGQGRTWAMRDSVPLGGSLPFDQWENAEHLVDRHGLLVAPGTPPGDYELRLSVAAGDDDRPLEVADTDGRPMGTELTLGTVRVQMPGLPQSSGQLPIEQRLSADLSGSVRFLGHGGPDRSLAPGDLLEVSLYWQATQDIEENLTAFLQLLDQEGDVVAGWEAPPGAGFPTDHWREGDLFRTQAALRLPAMLPDGQYQLITGLFRSEDGVRLEAGRHDRVELGTVQVVGRAHNYAAPEPEYPLTANFADVAVLVGYDITAEDPLRPSTGVALTLYWQSLDIMTVPYTVFVHLLDEDGQIRGQGDGQPGAGAYPTTGWVPGEYLVDARSIAIHADAADGWHTLEIGLYDPATSARLPLLDEAGRMRGDSLLLEQTPLFVER